MPSFLNMFSSTPATAPRRAQKFVIPNHHGAWPIILLPFLVGTFAGQIRLAHLFLLALLLTGYTAFFTVSLYIRSHFKPRYRVAARNSVLLAVIPAALVFWQAAYLIWWGVWFIPLIALAFYSAWRRNERGLAPTVLHIFLALLLGAMAYDISTGGLGGMWGTGWYPDIWRSWWSISLHLNGTYPEHSIVLGCNWGEFYNRELFLTAYLLGSSWAVKTVIKQRGKLSWALFSVSWAVVSLVVFTAGTLIHLKNFDALFQVSVTAAGLSFQQVGWGATRVLFPVTFALALLIFALRAVVFALWGMRGEELNLPKIKPAQIAAIEFVMWLICLFVSIFS